MGGPLGDPDAVPIADYHLPNWVAWNLVGEARADDDRYGPRRSSPDIRGF